MITKISGEAAEAEEHRFWEHSIVRVQTEALEAVAVADPNSAVTGRMGCAWAQLAQAAEDCSGPCT